MAQTANVCVSMIPVISGRQDVLQSAVLRDVVRQSVDHAPKLNNKITLRKEERKRERERMSLAGTRHAAGHKRQRAFPRVCSSAEGLRVEAGALFVIQKERANAMLHLHTAKKSCRIYACLMCSHHEPHRILNHNNSEVESWEPFFVYVLSHAFFLLFAVSTITLDLLV